MRRWSGRGYQGGPVKAKPPAMTPPPTLARLLWEAAEDSTTFEEFRQRAGLIVPLAEAAKQSAPGGANSSPSAGLRAALLDIEVLAHDGRKGNRAAWSQALVEIEDLAREAALAPAQGEAEWPENDEFFGRFPDGVVAPDDEERAAFKRSEYEAIRPAFAVPASPPLTVERLRRAFGILAQLYDDELDDFAERLIVANESTVTPWLATREE